MAVPLESRAPHVAERCQAARQSGNALPDARQIGDDPTLHPLPDALFRTPADLLTGLRQALTDAPAGTPFVRHFMWSRRLRSDVVVTLGADGVVVQRMTSLGDMHEAGPLESEMLAPAWLDSRRRWALLHLGAGGDPAAAIAVSREAWEAADRDDVVGRMAHGDVLVLGGDIPGALVVWQQIHTDHPHYAPPLVRLAEALLEAGVQRLDQEALRAADAASALAVERFADHVPARMVRGRFHWAVSQPPQARGQFEAVLALDPQNVDASIHLGMLAAGADDHRCAARHFGDVIARNPDHADARRMMAVCQAHLGHADHARAHLAAAERLAPADPRLADARADVATALGE